MRRQPHTMKTMFLMKTFGRLISGSITLLVALALASCGGGGGGAAGGSSTSYTISATVTGLTGTGLVLQNNAADNRAVAANGSVTFATGLASGAAYNVTVSAAPGAPAQLCTVTSGSGIVAAGNISNIAVTCQNTAIAAYVVNLSGNSISQYRVETDGSLTAMAPATVATGLTPNSIAVDPSGRFAYVSNDDGTISQYSIAIDGKLSPMVPATVLAGLSPSSVVVSPSGAYVYATNESRAISQYRIGLTGGLIPLAPATALAGLTPVSIAIDPSSKYAYVANSDSNNVSQFAIAADGTLSPMAIPFVLAGLSPVSVTVDPSGRYVFATNFDGHSISQYTIGIGGSLTPSAVAFGLCCNLLGIAANPKPDLVNPSARKIYVADFGANAVFFLTVSGSGVLGVPMPDLVALANPIAVVVDPTGRFAYVTTANNLVVKYNIGSDGTLGSPTTFATGMAPVSIALR